MTGSRECSRGAWARSKASEVSVLPPPVGTVSVKTPCGSAARGDGCAPHIIAQRVELARRYDALSHPVVQLLRRDGRVVDPRASSPSASAVRSASIRQEDHAGEEGELKATLALWPPHAHGLGDAFWQIEAISLGHVLDRE